MYKAYKYRIYPNLQQRQLLEQTFGCVRFVWNCVLKYRSEQYTMNKVKINHNKASKKLTGLKSEYPFLYEVSAVALQQTLRNQDVAFKNFFAKRSLYPKFKCKDGKQSFRLASSGFTLKDKKLCIAKLKAPIKVVWPQDFGETPKSITISKDPSGRYFVSFLCETHIETKSKIDKIIGVDVGLTHFAITSDGNKEDNQRFTRKYELKLAKLQRRVAKKQKGSKNRLKAKLKVARTQAKIQDSRKDFLHKLSSRLIDENQVICLEDLNVAGMVRNRKLAKSIQDASWSTFTDMLQYKADWYGRTIIKISPFYPSSQICSHCGHRDGKKDLSIRKWWCTHCGTEHDRDINAAKNILTAGTAELACGVSSVGEFVLKEQILDTTTMKQESLKKEVQKQ